MLAALNGLLIWIFRGFGVAQLDAHIVIAGTLVPFVFFLGVPRAEVWRLSNIVAGKLLVSPDYAQAALHAARASLSSRGAAVTAVALANSATVASLGVQVGVMAGLAPSRRAAIARGAIPAILVAFVCHSLCFLPPPARALTRPASSQASKLLRSPRTCSSRHVRPHIHILHSAEEGGVGGLR